jgi:hypothetical protein
LNLTGISLTSISRDANGVVTAVGTATGNLLGQAFSTSVTLTATPSADPAGTPVLDLHLGPIDLNLLGLEVKTSEICLNITAIPSGQTGGGPLGSLVSNLLGSSGVSGLLGSLSSDLNTLLGDLNGLLGGSGAGSLLGALNQDLAGLTGTATIPTGAAAHTDPAATNILDLSLGPVNLDLLGLDVTLNNCANPGGPVTVDIIAHHGPGDLLGNLLGGVAGLLNNPNLNLANEVNALLGLIENI